MGIKKHVIPALPVDPIDMYLNVVKGRTAKEQYRQAITSYTNLYLGYIKSAAALDIMKVDLMQEKAKMHDIRLTSFDRRRCAIRAEELQMSIEVLVNSVAVTEAKLDELKAITAEFPASAAEPISLEEKVDTMVQDLQDSLKATDAGVSTEALTALSNAVSKSLAADKEVKDGASTIEVILGTEEVEEVLTPKEDLSNETDTPPSAG